MIKLLMMFLVAGNFFAAADLCAAAVWVAQPERFNTFNTTPGKARQTLVRVPVGDLEAVRPEWQKIGDEWIKEVSSGGAVRYIAAPSPDPCLGKFVCHQSWGWIVNISMDEVMKCPAIKITNEQLAFFDAVVVDIKCPSYLK